MTAQPSDLLPTCAQCNPAVAGWLDRGAPLAPIIDLTDSMSHGQATSPWEHRHRLTTATPPSLPAAATRVVSGQLGQLPLPAPGYPRLHFGIRYPVSRIRAH